MSTVSPRLLRYAESQRATGARWRGFDAVITILFALGGWRTGLAPLSDNSFLCHLRTGRWMLEHGIPRMDVFSFTVAGRPWVAESWLADVIYGWIDARFGAAGILAFNAVICAAIAALWYRLALRLCGDRVNAAVVAALSLGASWTIWSPRPLMVGILCLLVLAWIVESNPRYGAAGLPPLMWIWSNIHGSFVLGFGYLGLHFLRQWIEGRPPWRGRERVLILWSAAALALCFLNPYGPALIAAPFHLLARHNVLRYVTEWRPAGIGSIQAAMYALWLATFALCEAAGDRRGIRSDLIIALPFITLGILAERNIAIAPVVTMPLAARAIRQRSRIRSDANPRLNTAVAVMLIALAATWTAKALAGPQMDFSTYPVDAMSAVENQGLLGRRLLSTDAWGDYIIYRDWPRQLVFIDDRYDLYPPSIFFDMFNLLSGANDWHTVLERYQIEVVVWPPSKPAVEALDREPGWERIFQDKVAIVYRRTVLLTHR